MKALIYTAIASVWLLNSATAAGFTGMYTRTVLETDAERYEKFTDKLYNIGVRPHLTENERRVLDKVIYHFPYPDPDDHPLNFYSYSQGSRSYVVLPLLSMKVVEDLTTAYAWIWANDYSFDTIDIYAAMLKYKPASTFPGRRYPPPLDALGIPTNALSDERVDEMSLRLRNSAYAFTILHELGHILYGHRGYEGISRAQARADEEQADRFALDVLERTGTIPMGAVIFFQVQVYSMPHRGQFKSEDQWDRYLRDKSTHPLNHDRLMAIARHMDAAAGRDPRSAERDSKYFIASRLAEISNILEDPLLERCIAAVASNATPVALKLRRHIAEDEMQRWCRKKR